MSKHAINAFESGELEEPSVCAKFAQTADDGKSYQYKYYSLPVIISVGYRTNSSRVTQFRQWATKVLDTFTKQGYVLDKNRLINGQIFDEDYFEHLISEIQEIRANERRFYQKITDAILNYGTVSVINLDGNPEIEIQENFDIDKRYKKAAKSKLEKDSCKWYPNGETAIITLFLLVGSKESQDQITEL